MFCAFSYIVVYATHVPRKDKAVEIPENKSHFLSLTLQFYVWEYHEL